MILHELFRKRIIGKAGSGSVGRFEFTLMSEDALLKKNQFTFSCLYTR